MRDTTRPVGRGSTHGDTRMKNNSTPFILRLLIASGLAAGSKKCLCIEIKWFIEPAEIREVMARSEEISRGVVQALKINELFENRDSRLLSLLEVDESYDLLTMVGSVNFIGRHGVQNPEVPIAKLWHIAAELRANGSLDETMKWLRARTYLPKKDIDYKVSTVEIRCGKWKSHWYGIAHA